MNARLNAKLIVSMLPVFIGLCACGPMKLGTGAAAPTDTTHALDGVKFISPSIGRGDDPRTFLQKQYSVSSTGRVLVRFESLTANQSRILNTQPIILRIFAPDATEQTNAVANLKACPIVADWMMAATWSSAHPYRGGGWPDGSPLAHDECVDAIAPASATGDCATANAVCYDVSQWYKSYVVEHGKNFGHALITQGGAVVVIQGDGSYSKGPRIQWSE